MASITRETKKGVRWKLPLEGENITVTVTPMVPPTLLLHRILVVLDAGLCQQLMFEKE